MPKITRMTEKLLVGRVARIKGALRRVKQIAVNGKGDSRVDLDAQEELPRPHETVCIDDLNTENNARIIWMPSISPIFHVWEITVGRHKFLLPSTANHVTGKLGSPASSDIP